MTIKHLRVVGAAEPTAEQKVDLNPQLVEVLERLLVEAKAGNLRSMVGVADGPRSTQEVIVLAQGSQPTALLGEIELLRFDLTSYEVARRAELQRDPGTG